MGWDVVEIGLRHNLPVDDPFAIAQEVAKRMNRNVRLVYRIPHGWKSGKKKNGERMQSILCSPRIFRINLTCQAKIS